MSSVYVKVSRNFPASSIFFISFLSALDILGGLLDENLLQRVGFRMELESILRFYLWIGSEVRLVLKGQVSLKEKL